MDERTSKDIVEVCWKNNMTIIVKIVYGKEILNVLSAQAPLVGIEEPQQENLGGSLIDDMVQNIPIMRRSILEMISMGTQGVHEGFVFGTRNTEGDCILDFVLHTICGFLTQFEKEITIW